MDKEVADILKIMFTEQTPKSVFEVGCSEGKLLEQVRNLYGESLHVGGIDHKQNYIDEAKRIFKSRDFVCLDAQKGNWPFADKSFDIVYTVGTLMYMQDPITALREMFRIGKTVMIAEPHNFFEGELGRVLGKDHHGICYVRNYFNLLHFLGRTDVRFINSNDKLIIKSNE